VFPLEIKCPQEFNVHPLNKKPGESFIETQKTQIKLRKGVTKKVVKNHRNVTFE